MRAVGSLLGRRCVLPQHRLPVTTLSVSVLPSSFALTTSPSFEVAFSVSSRWASTNTRRSGGGRKGKSGTGGGAAAARKGPSAGGDNSDDDDDDEIGLLDDLPEPKRWAVKEFRGVWAEETAGPTVYEAVITVNGAELSGGEFESAKEAAKAYDALALMYGQAEEGPALNFDKSDYLAWSPADFQRYQENTHIEAIEGKRLTVEEVTGLLEAERGIDVTSLDLEGRSDLADHMIWVTGRSVPHMRKLGRLVVRALRERKLPGFKNPELEGRDMDDWMVVDCGNLIVNIMDAQAREVFDLEAFYRDMKLGEDPYEGWTFEEWLEANPVPDKWIQRLEQDDLDMAQAKRR